jgi:hypothetical protein
MACTGNLALRSGMRPAFIFCACAVKFIASSFNRRCYDRDNGYKTHRAKRLGLLQGHYNSDNNLEGIPKRKEEAIRQSTFSFS